MINTNGINKSYDIMDYIIHGVYFLFYGFVKYIPPPVGNILRYLISKLFIRKMKKVSIQEGVTLWYPYRITIGTDVTLNEWVYISGYGGVTIGNGVRIGHRTSIISSDHCYEYRDIPIYKQGLKKKPVYIADNVWIGCNAIILGGITIGRGTIVAAGAVVTKDVPEFSIIAGVPARVIGVRDGIYEDIKS